MEKLELVHSFDELRVGMIVVVKYLGQSGRFFLLRKDPDELRREGHCFAVLPNRAPSGRWHILSVIHVEAGGVFRVVDVLEQSTQTAARKKEPARG